MEILGSLQNIANELYRRHGISLEINGCIHIGAHEGQEYPLYKQLGIENLLFYEPLPDNFAGLKEKVGPEVKLRNMGINTCKDLQKYQRVELIEMFGKHGNELYNLSRGIDNRQVKPERKRKSFSLEKTYLNDLTYLKSIKDKQTRKSKRYKGK